MIFEFSKEKGTYAYNLKPQVLKRVKQKRRHTLLELQKEISNNINSKIVGKKIPSIIETIQSDGITIGRTYKDAPNVDGYIFVNTDVELMSGDFAMVRITGALEYDLIGELM